MTALIDKLKLDLGYDHSINADYNSKTGNFWFEQGYDLINVAFTSDENGNVNSLNVIEALDGNEEPMEFVITDDVYKVMKAQIEPMLWADEPSKGYDTARSLGFSNSDFLFGA